MCAESNCTLSEALPLILSERMPHILPLAFSGAFVSLKTILFIRTYSTRFIWYYFISMESNGQIGEDGNDLLSSVVFNVSLTDFLFPLSYLFKRAAFPVTGKSWLFLRATMGSDYLFRVFEMRMRRWKVIISA